MNQITLEGLEVNHNEKITKMKLPMQRECLQGRAASGNQAFSEVTV